MFLSEDMKNDGKNLGESQGMEKVGGRGKRFILRGYFAFQ
jgi:hypothetical protein